ncbi:MAG: alcohol dehydrogenase catalytic domain-containing protein [Thermoanaerobaculia bacterium]
MKAALVKSLDEIEMIEMPVPTVGRGELLVEMKAVGLCGSDLAPWYVASKAPAVLGHEPAGIVAAVGDGVTAFRPGDRVFVHHHAACGRCRFCEAGEPVMCPAWKPNRLHPGGLAEFFRAEAATVATDTLLIPDDLSFEDGALAEPVACALKAVDRGAVRKSDVVAVIGLGSSGVLLGLLAREAGAGRLLGSDPDPARRASARKLGFDRVLDPAEGLARIARDESAGRGADAVFLLPYAAPAFDAAMEAAAPAGRVVFYSPVPPETRWSLAPHTAYLRDLTLRFSYSCGASELKRAMALIARGVVRADRIVTHRVPLAEAPEAFRLARARGDVLKVMVTR